MARVFVSVASGRSRTERDLLKVSSHHEQGPKGRLGRAEASQSITVQAPVILLPILACSEVVLASRRAIAPNRIPRPRVPHMAAFVRGSGGLAGAEFVVGRAGRRGGGFARAEGSAAVGAVERGSRTRVPFSWGGSASSSTLSLAICWRLTATRVRERAPLLQRGVVTL